MIIVSLMIAVWTSYTCITIEDIETAFLSCLSRLRIKRNGIWCKTLGSNVSPERKLI